MSLEKIIRAWKDEEYRLSLNEEELAQLPTHPAGIIELTDEALDHLLAQGGSIPESKSCWTQSC